MEGERTKDQSRITESDESEAVRVFPKSPDQGASGLYQRWVGGYNGDILGSALNSQVQDGRK